MIDYLKQLPARLRESVTFLSVQVQAIWAFAWYMWSQLPPDELVRFSTLRIAFFTVPTWMGLAHAASTYMARLYGTGQNK